MKKQHLKRVSGSLTVIYTFSYILITDKLQGTVRKLSDPLRQQKFCGPTEQLLPSRTIDVPLMVLEIVLSANSKCSLTDLTKRPGAALKKKKRLKESDGVWVGTGLFVANYPFTTPALSSQGSVAFLLKLGS